VPTLTSLQAYRDERGNEIVFPGTIDENIKIKFTGSNNRLVVAGGREQALRGLTVDFDCDNGVVEIGPSRRGFSALIRVGQDSCVVIGKDVSSSNSVGMSATEGTSIVVGDDVMFASDNRVRADDAHPIFDVRTGRRVNASKSIVIGNHVWLGRAAVLLGGAQVGDGSVIGLGSIVTGRVPNNCVAAGVPARVVRRDIAWERDHLSLTKPFYKPTADSVTKTPYWNLTEDGEPGAVTAPGTSSRALSTTRRLLRGARKPFSRDPVTG
jgi:acetyltransferase-like isoleucine patch superfamily enzyme